MSEGEGQSPHGRLKQLDNLLGTPVLFALASSTVGLVSGFITGGVTAVATNIIETPAARPHILRLTRIFGTAQQRPSDF